MFIPCVLLVLLPFGIVVLSFACRARAAIFSAVAAGLFNVLVEPELSTSDPPDKPPFIFISRVNWAIISFWVWRSLVCLAEIADVSK